MATALYDFEKPVGDIEAKLEKLVSKESEEPKHLEEIESTRNNLRAKMEEVYGGMSAFQKVLIARKPDRPHAQEYIRALFDDFEEIHGDRGYADDKAVMCGFGSFNGVSCAAIGQLKGREVKENLQHNFGMMHPEGYRKALRVMKLAGKFGLPIVTFIDTPGAYPGVQAEERGQFEAIARNIRDMFNLPTPVICVVIGEGASGGAIGIGVGNRALMLENAWYSVISPEGCASILWRDAKFAPEAAEALKLTADHLHGLRIIDEIIAEPLGGAHRDPQTTFDNTRIALARHLDELRGMSPDELMAQRFEKYRRIGEWETRAMDSERTEATPQEA